MRDPIRSTLGAIERDVGGIAIVWCPDFGLRQWLVGEVESLVPSNRGAFRTASLEEALAAPDRLALWVPADETEAVLDLDGSRDRLRNDERPRTQPIVLFLLRHGDGKDALERLTTSLWSITGGSDVDPEDLAEIDLPVERQLFEEDYGRTPEAWLEDWRKDAMPLTSENIGISYRAKLLERT